MDGRAGWLEPTVGNVECILFSVPDSLHPSSNITFSMVFPESHKWAFSV